MGNSSGLTPIRHLIVQLAQTTAEQRRLYKGPGSPIDVEVLDPFRPIMRTLGQMSAGSDEHFNWCAAWVTSVLRRGGINLPDRHKEFYASLALCDSWRAMGQDLHAWFEPKSGRKPKPGDIALFNFDKDTATEHIGIYLMAKDRDAFLSAEGNHHDAEDLVKRKLELVQGFIDLDTIARSFWGMHKVVS